MYSQTTHSVVVNVEPFYLESQSAPEENRYLWAYRVSIRNEGGESVHLERRFWSIVDDTGRTQTVDGEGVVGEQPILKPGEIFIYTSGVPLQTPSGIMSGHYEMRTESGELLEVAIPAFSLDSPYGNIRLN